MLAARSSSAHQGATLSERRRFSGVPGSDTRSGRAVYFEKRLQILAVESTTKEIHISLKQKEMEGALVEKVIEVLEGADLAKFAKWLPEPVEIIRINKKAKEIIDDLKPKEVPHGV